jgi:TRAP-type mannitol/chloroaromatic compound transport system permease small subunit
MGTGLVLFFFLGGVWMLFEMIFGLLPRIKKRSLRIGLVVGTFPMSLFLIGYTALMALDVLRSGEVPPGYGKLFAWAAIALAFVFPVGFTFMAFRKYQETKLVKSRGSETENDGA